MTRSRIRSTRLSLASRCSGLRLRSGFKSGVGGAEAWPSVCSNRLHLTAHALIT